MDTSAKEREIEEKLQKQQVDVKNRSRTTSERSSDTEHEQPKKSASIFGQAKPVDTMKREREIEEKLRKTDINEDHADDVKNNKPAPQSSNKGAAKEKRERSPPPMKKIEEAKAPNFAGSNKYAFLPEADED